MYIRMHWKSKGNTSTRGLIHILEYPPILQTEQAHLAHEICLTFIELFVWFIFFSSAPQAAPVDEPQVFMVEPLGTRPYSIYVYN